MCALEVAKNWYKFLYVERTKPFSKVTAILQKLKLFSFVLIFDVKYPQCISGVLQFFLYYYNNEDNEFKGTKFATFMAELKKKEL